MELVENVEWETNEIQVVLLVCRGDGALDGY